MSNCGSATFAEGKLITNATSRNVATARAARLCALLGGRKEISHGCWISGMDWLTRLGYGLVSLRFARNSKSGHLMPMDRGKDAVWLGGSGAEKRRVRPAGDGGELIRLSPNGAAAGARRRARRSGRRTASLRRGRGGRRWFEPPRRRASRRRPPARPTRWRTAHSARQNAAAASTTHRSA